MSSADSYVGPAYTATANAPVAVEWGARCIKPSCSHAVDGAPFKVSPDRAGTEAWIARQPAGQYVLMFRPILGWTEVDTDELDH